MTAKKPSIVPPASVDNTPIQIAKPAEFSLDKFRSKRSPAIAGVETLLTALPHYSMSQAKDFVRLHPDEENYWSPEFCFVHVPIKGQKRETLHLIEEELGVRHLPSGRILRFRLALATKPNDVFFCAMCRRRIWITSGTNPICKRACKRSNNGHRQPAVVMKVSTATRSTAPETRILSPSRIGRRKSSKL
jgi:hypothetical protein